MPLLFQRQCRREAAPVAQRLRGAALAWAAAILTLYLGAMAVCPHGHCTAPAWDHSILQLLHETQHPGLTAFFEAATWLGSIALLLPASLFLAWRYWQRGQPRAALLLPLAVGGAWVLAHAGKLLVNRPRPDFYPPLIDMPADLSFPSAHTLQITTFTVAWLLARRSRLKWHGIVAAALVVTVVAWSRLYLQVHFPSDVLAGLMVGAAWAIGLRLLLETRT